MSLNKIPSWFIVGIMIYPLIILVGLIFSLATSGDFNFLYWLYIPSLMFQDLFKKCCENIASNNKLILLSGFIFWFIIGAILGLIVKTIKCSQIITKEEINIEEKRDEEQNRLAETPKEEIKEEPKEEEKIEQPKTEEEQPKEEIKEEPKEEDKKESIQKPRISIKEKTKSKKQVKKKK